MKINLCSVFFLVLIHKKWKSLQWEVKLSAAAQVQSKLLIGAITMSKVTKELSTCTAMPELLQYMYVHQVHVCT